MQTEFKMMPDPHYIPADEYGYVRIFTTELEPEGDAAITASNVHKILGKDVSLNPKKVVVIPSKVLVGMGLTRYLLEGYGIAEQDIAGKSAALNALTGLIILIPSSAFLGREQTLDPNSALRFIGTFREQSAQAPGPMSKPTSAEGSITPPVTSTPRPVPRQRPGSWIIALGALIIAAALVLFIVL